MKFIRNSYWNLSMWNPYESAFRCVVNAAWALSLGIIRLLLGLRPASERRRYKVTPSLIGAPGANLESVLIMLNAPNVRVVTKSVTRTVICVWTQCPALWQVYHHYRRLNLAKWQPYKWHPVLLNLSVQGKSSNLQWPIFFDTWALNMG